MANNQAEYRGLWSLTQHFAPGLASFRNYQRSWLGSDLAAGLSVAAIALPVGIAYSDLAGVPAVVGMYSAIFPLFLYALFGSSRQLMTGPDAATCIIAAAAIGPLANGDAERYMALMVMLTLITAVLYIISGFLRLGFIANFLSQPILAGYLNGIALIILVGQLPKLFGYSSDAEGFFSKIAELFETLGQNHVPTMVLGIVLLVTLALLRRFMPKIPAALVIVILGIIAVIVFKLDQRDVAILGALPAGLPTFGFALFEFNVYMDLFHAAAGIVLISFTSGVLTAKSFARKNRYDIDANQELFGFGACNLASGLAQGFPVTGADSRTAVNDAMGGKTQLVGIVAAVTMLLILFFLTTPLGYVPVTALAAVIMVSAVGLFDFSALRELYEINRREFLLSIITTVGVLIIGVLPGVMLAIVLSLIWLLKIDSRPHDAVLGKVPGMKGFHSLEDYPNATTIPGLILYRFESNLLFFNVDFFRERVREVIAQSDTVVKWFVIDAHSVNLVDVTAIQKLDELREELANTGIVLAIARPKRSVLRFYSSKWRKMRFEDTQLKQFRYDSINSAISAFKKTAPDG